MIALISRSENLDSGPGEERNDTGLQRVNDLLNYLGVLRVLVVRFGYYEGYPGGSGLASYKYKIKSLHYHRK